MAVVGICLACTQQVSAIEKLSPYAISDRVGAEIDGQERDYFGLFPGVDWFISAQTHMKNDGEVIITVTRSQAAAGDTAVSVSPENVAELKAYIENFEAIVEGAREIGWSSIYSLARLPDMTLDAPGDDATVTMKSGQKLSGAMLFASSDILLLSQCEEPFSWSSSKTCNRAIIPADILQIDVSTGTGFWKGMGVGTGIGVVAGLMMVGKLDDWGREHGDDGYTFRGYMIGGAVAGGVGLIVGTWYGASRGSKDKMEISGESRKYRMHLEELRGKTYFKEKAPPEFRQYKEGEGLN